VFHSHILALSNMDTKARRPTAGVRAGPNRAPGAARFGLSRKIFQGGTKIEPALLDEQETWTEGTIKMPVSRYQRRERPDAKSLSFIAFGATSALPGT
jgi:hypothetical protein